MPLAEVLLFPVWSGKRQAPHSYGSRLLPGGQRLLDVCTQHLEHRLLLAGEQARVSVLIGRLPSQPGSPPFEPWESPG